MQWKVAKAKQQLSELLRQAASEPQQILNRDKVVAVVLGPREMEAFERWRKINTRPSLAQALAKAQEICAEEDYVLPHEPRRDRDNSVLMVNDVGRHKRRQ